MRFVLGFLLLILPVSVFPHDATRHPSREEIRLHLLGDMSPLPAADSVAMTLTPSSAKKSPGLAVLYSLLLPGMGEFYAEESSGKYFLIAEGVLWLTYAAFDVRGNSLKADARSYSAVHAGVTTAGKNDQFFVDVGNFANLDDYNTKKLRDREPDKVYSAAEGYQWQWDSDNDRLTFRDQRISGDQWLNNRKFVGAAILLNHVASAINAARAAIRYNNALADPLGDLEIGTRMMGTASVPRGVGITLSKPF